MRCLTLADALRQSGAEVTFLTAPLPGEWAQAIAARGFRAFTAPAGMTTGAEDDIRWTRSCLAGQSWDWVIDDHYGIGEVWERAAASEGCRILAIDDLADRPHHCDLLLDQNYLPDRERAYRSLTPPGIPLLLGPRFALLRREYAEYRAQVQRVPGPIARVLVFFGGTDPLHLTEQALEALQADVCRGWDVDVVCGGDAARMAGLQAMADARGRTTVFGPRPHLADLMAAADVTLCAGGATTWERMCLGLAALTVTVAPNQIPLATWLASEQLIVLLGAAETLTVESMRTALIRLASSPSRAVRDGWPDVAQGMALSDGRGLERVVAAMTGAAA